MSIPSTTAVLPWSTWAMIAMLRSSERSVNISHQKTTPAIRGRGSVRRWDDYVRCCQARPAGRLHPYLGRIMGLIGATSNWL